MILNFINTFFERVSRAATTKAKQKTVGKAQAKVMGAQAAAMQKAMRGVDKGMEGVEGRVRGGVANVAGGAQPGAAPGQPGAPPMHGAPMQYGGPPVAPQPGAYPQQGPYQPVNQDFAPVHGNVGGPAVPQPQAQAGLFCPNGHALDPSWEVCPYCRSAAQQGVKAVHVQAAGAEMGDGKTVAFNPADIVGTDHVNKAVVGWVVCMEGPQKGHDFRLHDGRNVIGTAADCEIVVYDQWVSARHCVLLIESDKAKYVLQDLDARNGTFVNTRQISKQELIDNDEIKLGKVKFRFKSLY